MSWRRVGRSCILTTLPLALQLRQNIRSLRPRGGVVHRSAIATLPVLLHWNIRLPATNWEVTERTVRPLKRKVKGEIFKLALVQVCLKLMSMSNSLGKCEIFHICKFAWNIGVLRWSRRARTLTEPLSTTKKNRLPELSKHRRNPKNQASLTSRLTLSQWTAYTEL